MITPKSPTFVDSEQVVMAYRALRKYNDARAKGDNTKAWCYLADAGIHLHVAQSALWNSIAPSSEPC